MAPLMRKGERVSILILAGAFVLAGVALAVRTIVRRRRSSERRRLASLSGPGAPGSSGLCAASDTGDTVTGEGDVCRTCGTYVPTRFDADGLLEIDECGSR